MIKSMTGFGRGEYSDGKRNVTAEIKTVNHRYSDITVKMPKRYSFAEEPIKAVIREKLRRGKAEVSIVIENITEEQIRQEVRRAIDTYCPAGRFYPSIPNGVCFRPWNNSIVMDELASYGRKFAQEHPITK